MRVGLIATSGFADVRFVAGVNVAVFLTVRGVGESSVASVKLAHERLFTWTQGVEWGLVVWGVGVWSMWGVWGELWGCGYIGIGVSSVE